MALEVGFESLRLWASYSSLSPLHAVLEKVSSQLAAPAAKPAACCHVSFSGVRLLALWNLNKNKLLPKVALAMVFSSCINREEAKTHGTGVLIKEQGPSKQLKQEITRN